jgi:hypothetical protein
MSNEIELSVGDEIVTVFHGGSTTIHADKCFTKSERFAETYGDVSVYDIDLTGLTIATIGDETSRFDTGGYPGDGKRDAVTYAGVDILKYWDLAQDSDRIAGWVYRIWSAAAVAATSICEE